MQTHSNARGCVNEQYIFFSSVPQPHGTCAKIFSTALKIYNNNNNKRCAIPRTIIFVKRTYLKQRLFKTRWVAKCIQHNSNLERKFILYCCCFFFLCSSCWCRSLLKLSYVRCNKSKYVPGNFCSFVIARMCVVLMPTPPICFRRRKEREKSGEGKKDCCS